MMTRTFSELVELVVSKNGDGHKEVYRLRDAGEITEEEANLILLSASVQTLHNKVIRVAKKIDDFVE